MYFLFRQQKNYTSAWDKIKATSYQIPPDSNALQHAKQQKVILSSVSPTVSSVNVVTCLSSLSTANKHLVSFFLPLGEVQGGLWEVQDPLQFAQVPAGWSCNSSLR